MKLKPFAIECLLGLGFALVIVLTLANAEARDVTIAWDDYAAPGAVGIHVYTQDFDYAASACLSSTANRVTSAPLPVTATTYTIAGLADAQTYCVWVRGIDASGSESDYSNAAMVFAPRLPFDGPAGVRVTP